MNVFKLTFVLTLGLLIRTCDVDTVCQKGQFKSKVKIEDGIITYLCKPCTLVCPANKTLIEPCEDSHDIRCCQGGNYDYDEQENCRQRPKICRKGHFWNPQENFCKPCPDGTFMNENNHSYTKCFDCQYKSEADRPIHTDITNKCNRTQPSRYGCKKNYYLNHSMSDRDDIGCIPCKTCDEGNYVGRQCDMYHDTVCCDKPNMTVVSGPQGELCVDEKKSTDKSDACDCIVPWLLFGLVLIVIIIIVMIMMCCHLRRVGHFPFCQKQEIETAKNVKKNLVKVTKERDESRKECHDLKAENDRLIMEVQTLKKRLDDRAPHNTEEDHREALQADQVNIRPGAAEHGPRQDEESKAKDERETWDLCFYRKGLKSKESDEQASAAKDLCEMAKDEHTRLKIRDFDGMVEALKNLENSENRNVKANVRKALQVITGTTLTTDSVEDGHPPAQLAGEANNQAVIPYQVPTSASDEGSHIVEIPTSASDEGSHVLVEVEEPNEEAPLMVNIQE